MMLKEYVSQKLPFLQVSGKHVKPQGRRERRDDTPAASWGPDPMSAEEKAPAMVAAAPEADQPAIQEAPAPAQPDGQADFEAGMRACKERDYVRALEPLLRAAEAGHREAQFLCGQLYQRGLTAEADEKRALAWYKRSAKLGFLPAQMACAAMYEGGNGTAINMKRALYWYEQAAKQGSVPAQLKCGRMYYCGRAENRNPKKARSWLETAAGLGNEDAKKLLNEYF